MPQSFHLDPMLDNLRYNFETLYSDIKFKKWIVENSSRQHKDYLGLLTLWGMALKITFSFVNNSENKKLLEQIHHEISVKMNNGILEEEKTARQLEVLHNPITNNLWSELTLFNKCAVIRYVTMAYTGVEPYWLVKEYNTYRLGSHTLERRSTNNRRRSVNSNLNNG